MAAAALAIVLANSPASAGYFAALATPVGEHSLLHWINDGLMTLFFLLIGLEVKREIVTGELSTWGSRILPGAAAIAGMVVPALIYIAINHDVPANHRGWAIPAATDIAFALGVLALLGGRVPASLKLLVTAIAIIDDLGAIAVIAVAYTDHLDFTMLAIAGAGLAVLVLLNRLRVDALWPYLLIGTGIWYAVLQSGVHATLAGVAVAMTIPLTGRGTGSPLLNLEHRLSPVTALFVVPLFGFANAGIDLRGLSLGAIAAPLPLGIALGLLIGKQIGILGVIFALVRTGIAVRPEGASWRQLWGIALLCGIGFTMSLFIAGLAFGEGSTGNEAAKLGILGGSLAAALCGYLVLASGQRGSRA
ncbi:Na+/H+ antiporter NhaA [Glacieibacterium sp.]|uniref:Na+/H+ antiporter NhaA n=1 Tax=Glacieibacterium sp. TaxID=2860237 RepID=UPI003AFF8EE0